MKISKKAAIALVSLLVVGAAVTAFAIWEKYRGDIQGFVDKEKVGKTYYKSSFGDGSNFHSCSRDIEVEYKGSSLGPGEMYSPVDQEEFRKYCRQEAVIEYRAVIDILKRGDVGNVIAKYDTTQAFVRALGHTYIHDKDYLKRILPAYSDVKIDCIIVVHSPEGTRFFIENGEVHESHDDHRYIEVPADEFLASLNKASDEDVTSFWLGLH